MSALLGVSRRDGHVLRAPLVAALLGVVGIAWVLAAPAAGETRQTRQPQRPPARATRQAPPAVAIRGFADVGFRTFSASKSVEAVLGRSTGPVFGGGVEALLPHDTFVSLHVSRFRGTGERVFVSGGQTFPLGIATTITTTPIEVSGGYRFLRPRRRAVPFVGAGLGWHRYAETSEFAIDAENINETHVGYHALGGIEYRISRWVNASGQAQWTTVPGGLGVHPTSVAREFGESNLGGTVFHVRMTVGR
jgi:hypothetical protein